ncbi:hypothetical protein M798_07715 [Brucella melitensis ADMAS-G1]|nr:hypothetical protein M798_07715 [Brucella melitensis ADMAS-G1]
MSARFNRIETDRRSKLFFPKHNLDRPRFAAVGLCSKTDLIMIKQPEF